MKVINKKIVLSGLMAALALGFGAGCGPGQELLQQEQQASARASLTNQPLPDFSLKNHQDQTVTLKELRGQWVVIYIYPSEDTPACPCEETSYSKLLTEFHDFPAALYGINPDAPALHKAYIDTNQLGIELLSDPDLEFIRSCGALVPASVTDIKQGLIKRTTLIIDPQGVIRYHCPEVVAQGHVKRIRTKLTQLQKAQGKS